MFSGIAGKVHFSCNFVIIFILKNRIRKILLPELFE